MEVRWTKGEVIYQTKGVVVEPIYKDGDKYYIKDESGNYLDIGQMNPFNGYFYRQDGK